MKSGGGYGIQGYPTFPSYPVVYPQTPEIKPQSSIEYIPYQRTVIQYQPVEQVDLVPREVVEIQYKKVKRRGRRPVERTVIDYYQIQHILDYQQEIVSQKKTQYVEQEVPDYQMEYIPWQRQIVHYPSQYFQPMGNQPTELKSATQNVYSLLNQQQGSYLCERFGQPIHERRSVKTQDMDWQIVFCQNSFAIKHFLKNLYLECSQKDDSVTLKNFDGNPRQLWLLNLKNQLTMITNKYKTDAMLACDKTGGRIRTAKIGSEKNQFWRLLS